MKVQPPGLLGRVGRAIVRRPRRTAAAAAAVVLALGGWLAWLMADPDRPINRIEAGLARGEPQLLVGETGRPAWSHCSVGDKAAKVEIGRDGTLFVSTWSLTLVDLVRDPQCSSYLLRAEVRHDAARDPGGVVGVYVGHRKFAGQAHALLRLSFNEISGPRVELTAYLYREAGLSPNPEYTMTGRILPLQPVGVGFTDWRQLVLEVRPRAVRAFWEGQPLRTLGGVQEWATDKLAENVREHQELVRETAPQEPTTSLPPDFFPRGGLGLYVKLGSASFRRVVIEPLNETE
jgi:hypothetical protein